MYKLHIFLGTDNLESHHCCAKHLNWMILSYTHKNSNHCCAWKPLI